MEQNNNRPNVFPQGNGGDAEKKGNFDAQNREIIDMDFLDAPIGQGIPAQDQLPTNPVNQPQQPVTTGEYYVEPDYGSDFDIIPLPSKGKAYKHKKGEIKVSYLTAGDENILTNPNLIESGKFLDILFRRKILDPAFKYEELLNGDKDAILLWLRATAYGTDYTIQVLDPETLDYFEADIDLGEIPTIELEVEPDENCEFYYKLPIKGNEIKFRLLTVGDIKDFEAYQEKISKEKGQDRVDLATYSLKTIIKEVDGVRDPKFIAEFCQKMRLGDSRALKKYMDSIEPGKDMNLQVKAPGGSLVRTYFQYNPSFFWPKS
jgi:hypothetical protein